MYLDKIEAGEVIQIGSLNLANLKDPVHDSHVVYTPGRKEVETTSQVSWGTDSTNGLRIGASRSEMIQVAPSSKDLQECDKCKKINECRKWTEDGLEYKICAICALKAKLPWHKLEKL